MVMLEGIIYKVFEQYVVLRGFAPIGDLASISEKMDSYQRTTIDSHKRDIINFLKYSEYQYFPEIILAARANNYTEFLNDVKGDDDISPKSSNYVEGLFIKTEYIPISGHRARHANYRVEKTKLKRIDGNHRLEPFDEIDVSDNCWSVFPEIERKENKEKISKIIIPYCIIFTNNEVADKFEAGIFNNINFKQLPLKQEKNIQNIRKHLGETEELGYAHSLTMKLIDLAEKGHFKGLEHLTPKNNDDDIYRTACFKIAKLIIEKKNKINIKSDLENEINSVAENIRELEQSIKHLNSKLDNENKMLSNDEIEQIKNKQIKLYGAIRKKNHKENHKKQIETFLKNAENIDEIEIAIQSLRIIYKKMDKNIGNLSLLTTFVFYKLLDESKFNSFVDWVFRNKINEISVNDELPTNNDNSLIDLFEKVYEAKRKEVFISMKFGDNQSEMIYEKVIQTIEKYNRNKGYNISITPIRIDQTIKPCAFTIPDEIFEAIENSGLIIADLSSSNNNVYHEVGYAMGIAKTKKIGPPVILLYKTDTEANKDIDIDKFIDFNLRSFSQLRFTTYQELIDGLTKRLEVYFEI